MLALALSACSDSDSDPYTPPVEPLPPPTVDTSRQVSFIMDPQTQPTELQDVSVGNPNTRSLDSSYQYSYEVTDNGYVHVLRNDGYTITIADDNGETSYTDQTIVDGGTLSFSVLGDSTLSITHPDLENNTLVTTPYYTVATANSIDIPEIAETVTIELSNTNYALITLLPSTDVEQGTARINEETPTQVLNSQTEVTTENYSYDYVKVGSMSKVTATDKAGNNIELEGSPVVNKQYALSYVYIEPTVPDENNTGEGSIEIIPGWDDDIITLPPIEGGGGGVLPYSSILGAINLSTDSGTKAVSGSTDGKAVWAFQDDVGGGSIKVKESDFSFAVAEFTTDYYVNLYLLAPDGTKITEIIASDGSVWSQDNEDMFTDYNEFKNSKYAEYTIRDYRENYVDGIEVTSVTGNFFLRLGGSTYTGTDEFSIDSWAFQTLQTSPVQPVIDPQQISGATATQINADGSVSFITSTDYPTRLYIPVDGDKLLGGYDFISDIQSDAIGVNKGYINIYIKNGTEKERIDIQYNDGDQATPVCLLNGVGSNIDCDTLMETYKDWIVRNYVDSTSPSEGGIITGNFIWRSASSNAVGDADKFNVYDYSASYTTPESDPVIALDHIKGAKNVTVNSDNSVSGDVGAGGVATAYCDVDGDLLLGDYSNVAFSTEGAGNYMNIYLTDTSDITVEATGQMYRLNREPDTTYSVYIRDYASEIGLSGAKWVDASDYSMKTWADVMASDYAAMTVTNWTEGTMTGNFMTRFKDKSSEPNFTINEYTCN